MDSFWITLWKMLRTANIKNIKKQELLFMIDIPLDTCTVFLNSDFRRQQWQNNPYLIACSLTWHLPWRDAGGIPFAKRGRQQERWIHHLPVRNPMWSSSLWVQLNYALRWGMWFLQERLAGVCLSSFNAHYLWLNGAGAVGAHTVKCLFSCRGISFSCVLTVDGWSTQCWLNWLVCCASSSSNSISFSHTLLSLLSLCPCLSFSVRIRLCARARPWRDVLFPKPFLCGLHISCFLFLCLGLFLFLGFHTHNVLVLV